MLYFFNQTAKEVLLSIYLSRNSSNQVFFFPKHKCCLFGVKRKSSWRDEWFWWWQDKVLGFWHLFKKSHPVAGKIVQQIGFSQSGFNLQNFIWFPKHHWVWPKANKSHCCFYFYRRLEIRAEFLLLIPSHPSTSITGLGTQALPGMPSSPYIHKFESLPVIRLCQHWPSLFVLCLVKFCFD